LHKSEVFTIGLKTVAGWVPGRSQVAGLLVRSSFFIYRLSYRV